MNTESLKVRFQRTRKEPNPLLVIILITVCLFGFYGYVIWLNYHSPALYAVSGAVNADGINLKKGPYIVGGEWVKYGGLPDVKRLTEQQSSLIKDIRYLRYMKGNTYTFNLKTSNPEQIYLMLLRPRATKVWINEQRVLPEGRDTIGTTDYFHLSDYPGNSTNNYSFVIQISPQYPYLGYQGVLLGSEKHLRGIQDKWLLLSTITIGLYLMVILQCSTMYLQKRSEKYLGLLALFALTSLCDFLAIPRHPLIAFFNLGPATFYMLFNCLPYFICKDFVDKAVPHWMDRLVWSMIGLSFIVLFFIPAHTMLIFYYINLTYMIFEGWLLVVGLMRGTPGISILFAGWGINFGLLVFYLLLNNGLLPQGIVDIQIMPVQYAALIYIMAFALASNGRFARKFNEADELTATLETKVLEQTRELRESNRSIVELQQRKQQFMTDIVHNLHSPLFSLGGYLDLLKDEMAESTQEQKRNLDLMDKKLDYINKMVDDMFLIFRLEEGQIEFRFTQYKVKNLLENAVSDVNAKAKNKHISIRVNCEDSELVMVGDEFHFRQALDNLLDNAIRHSLECGRIWLGARRSSTGELVLTLADQGTGIPEERLPYIFERYTGKGEGGSTGLGLSITKEIVKRHHGKITVTSQEGRGTTFTITIPRIQ